MFLRLTVHKEGANNGRQFYACPEGTNNGCKFFSWAADDEASNDCKFKDTFLKVNYFLVDLNSKFVENLVNKIDIGLNSTKRNQSHCGLMS